MPGFLRLVQLLSIVVWVGGLCFFAFVLAPAAFRTLPSVREAGLIVGATLRVFDGVALGCGMAFLAATAMLFRGALMRVRGRYEMEFLLAVVMCAATAYIHWNILPAMEADRVSAGGDVSTVAATNPARMHFDRLHARSEKVEGAVLLVGLVVMFLISREQVAPQAGDWTPGR